MPKWIYLLQIGYILRFYEDIFSLSEKYYYYCVNQTHICYIEYSK